MENKKLNAWLLNNHKQLALKATQFHWTQDWMPDYCDLEVSIVLNGKQYVGRGMDKNSDFAFTKAGAEALERAFCFEGNVATCGVAVHTDEKLAKENAQNELIERDRFFCHYLTKTPFKKIDFDNYCGVQDKLKKYDVVMKIFEMNPLNNITSFVCLCEGERVGLVVGLGSSCKRVVAIEKAVTECLSNTVATLYGKSFSLSFKKFNSIKIYRPKYHRMLYFGERTLIEKNSWILEGRELSRKKDWIDENSFQYLRLKGGNNILGECPLVAIKCENNLLQKSFFGKFAQKHINYERIMDFSKVSDVNYLPHPLG